MTSAEKIKARLDKGVYVNVEFDGAELAIRLLTQAEYRRISFSKDDPEDKIINFVAEKFLEPETKQPAFDTDFLTNVLPQAHIQELLKIYFKIQNGAEDVKKN